MKQWEETLKQREEEVIQRAKTSLPSLTVNPNPGLPLQSQPSSSHALYPPSPDSIVPLGFESGSFPDDLDSHNVLAELKEGYGWSVVFNPKVKRMLDVSLVHTLMHEKYVPDEVKIGPLVD